LQDDTVHKQQGGQNRQGGQPAFPSPSRAVPILTQNAINRQKWGNWPSKLPQNHFGLFQNNFAVSQNNIELFQNNFEMRQGHRAGPATLADGHEDLRLIRATSRTVAKTSRAARTIGWKSPTTHLSIPTNPENIKTNPQTAQLKYTKWDRA
jgi:hypothetical protein